jgi:murein DD-endopeptidase MepM/ murein hydrolase activator NlpD
MARRLLLALIALAAITAPLALAAHRPAGAQTPPGATVHVVQRGETLYSIAARYGVTVAAIMQLNQLEDPDLLSVGQRLLIPAPGGAVPGAESYLVQPGDTLPAIARHARTDPARLAEANQLINPALLYVGQALVLPGAAPPAERLRGRLVIVQPGETLLALALRHDVRARALLAANGLATGDYVAPGDRVLIPQAGPPGDPGADSPIGSLPPPFEQVSLSPLPIHQGETLEIRVRAGGVQTLTGSFAGRPLAFARSGIERIGFGGVHALTDPGLVPLTLTAMDRDGATTELASLVRVAAGDFSTQYLELSAEVCAATFDPEVAAAERFVITSTTTVLSPRRYWDGPFRLPLGGDVTSAFGTRRRYNCAPDSLSYHEGLDLRGLTGTPVSAPAPGRVVLARELIVRGNAIVIDHGWGVFTGYWHLSKIAVEEGQLVDPGEYLGDVGSTGLSTGSHLHWEMRILGVPVDVSQWVRHTPPWPPNTGAP